MTVTPPDAPPAPVPDEASAAASVDLVERAARAAYDARTALDAAIVAAANAGAREAEITRASGLAKMTVRRVLGKVETKRGRTTRP